MHHPAFSFVAREPLRTSNSGRLAGWEIPVKDSTDVAGMPTTDGNPQRSRLAVESDPIVHMLLDAGAAIPAKTLTSELGATCYAERDGVPVLESPAYPGCTPGGSSTGAGVAVGLGLARAAHGTDAGGSIRVPAAACEVVGFKGRGRSIAAHGFLTRTVADQFTILGWPRPPHRRLRIGVLTEALFVDAAVDGCRGGTVDKLASSLQHDVVELHPYPEARETFGHFSTRIKRAFAKIDPLDNAYLAWLKAQGQRITADELDAAQAHCEALPGLLARHWGVDVLLSPTLAFDPPKLGYFSSLSPDESFYQQTVWSPWCSLFNVTGTPAVALGPVHLGALTINGAELLALAAEVEAILPGAER
ncbi:Enantioselective amidase [Corynebacterium glaucum]|uniref:amidase family protein n=1 Tax=Corynebacterium glaucum TaxID=187491 RepID=UPI0025B5F728|nr:amidase [Corynebacterium glaucum]WJZ08031.1 Enantioselective amidase [Corynebacterium glaucum]